MRNRRISLLALLLVPAVAAAAACGSSTNGTPDAGASDSGNVPDNTSIEDTGTSQDSAAPTDSGAEAASDGGVLGCPAFDAGTPFVEATHGSLPTMAYFGSPILAAPQIVSFTFPTTANVAALQAFTATITQTPWFAEVTKDYCVHDGGTCIGPGPTGLSVDITTAAAASYTDTFGVTEAGAGTTDLQQFVNEQVSAAVTAHTIPAPGPNSLYVFYFPAATTIAIDAPGQSGSSCGFGGYHNNMTYIDGKTPIYYAILPDCAGNHPTRELSSVTTAASHEIIEATTDTQPGGAWYLDQPMVADAAVTEPQFRNDPWATALTYGEVGDNCESVPLRTWALSDGGNVVQRIWSTSAAALGHNPCVPVPAGETYYNASTDKALYVANVGDTFTVDVSAFSEEARASWRLDALDYTNSNTAYLDLQFVGGVGDADGGGVSSLLCVNNGTTGQLKVTLLADPAADSALQQSEEWPEADGVIISYDVANPVKRTTADGGTSVSYPYQFWPFAVITPATAATLGVTSAGVADGRKLAAMRALRHGHSPRRLPLPLPTEP